MQRRRTSRQPGFTMLRRDRDSSCPFTRPFLALAPPPPCCRSSRLVLQLSPAQQRALMAALQDKFKGKGVKAGGADKWSHDGFDNMQG